MLIDQLFPRYCLMCNRVGDYLCKECLKSRVHICWDTYCCVCGAKAKKGLIHSECKEYTYLDGHIFVTSYDEGVKELIMQGKYSFNYNNFVFMGELMSKFLKFYNFSHDLTLVPIPSTPRKRRLRGFNQSEIMCETISRKTGYKSVKLLKKIKEVTAQADLTGEERRLNLKDTFSINSIAQNKLQKHKSIVLIDDVFTTGSTLNECARVLKENGFDKIYGYTFAKAGKA